MTIQVKTGDLKSGLGLIRRNISNRPSIPAMSGVNISVCGERAVLGGTDLMGYTELSITVKRSTGDWSGVVPFSTLFSLVSSYNDDVTTLSWIEEDLSLTISCGKNEATIKSYDSAEFPLLPKIGDENSIEVDAQRLYYSLSHVAGFTATDETRPTLTCVYFAYHDDDIYCMATDGFRLSYIENEGRHMPQVPHQSFLLPSALLYNSLLPVLKGEKGTVKISSSYDLDTKIKFGGNGWTVYGNLYDNRNFPDVTPIIPQSSTSSFVVSPVKWQSALNICTAFIDDSLPVEFGRSNEDVLVQSSNDETGNAESIIDTIQNNTEDDMKFKIGSGFALNSCRLAASDITVEYNDSVSPISIRHEIGGGLGVHTIIMPMH